LRSSRPISVTTSMAVGLRTRLLAAVSDLASQVQAAFNYACDADSDVMSELFAAKDDDDR